MKTARRLGRRAVDALAVSVQAGARDLDDLLVLFSFLTNPAKASGVIGRFRTHGQQALLDVVLLRLVGMIQPSILSQCADELNDSARLFSAQTRRSKLVAQEKTLGIDNIQLADMSLAILEPREFGCPLGSSPCSLLRHGPCFQEPNACKAILHFAKGSQHRLPIDGHVFLILRETIVQLSASGAAIEKRQRQRSPTNGPSRKVRLDQSKIRPSSADSNPPEAVRSSLGKKAAFAIPIRALAAAIARSAAAMSGRRSNRLKAGREEWKRRHSPSP